MNKKLAIKISAVTTSLLMGIFICGTVIANENEDVINNALKTSSFKKVTIKNDGEPQDVEYFKSEYENIKSLLEDGKKAVKEIEGEGVVLIKNENNALPLAKGSKVSLLGYNSFDPSYGGRGSGEMGGSGKVSPKEGFTKAGLNVNETALNFARDNSKKYEPGSRGGHLNDIPWADYESGASLLSSIEEYGDAAFYTIDRVGGEGMDLPPEHLVLSENEKSVLKGLNELKKQHKIKKIVVLLNVANAIQYDFVDDSAYGIDAALWVGNPGQTGYEAVGEIVVGDINPSGHLSDTFYKNIDANPVRANSYYYDEGARTYRAHKYEGFGYGAPANSHNYSYLVYQEGIYVGYRYSETRYADVVTGRQNAGEFDYSNEILRPFGYGESYTKFAYSNFNVTSKGKDNNAYYEISVDVKNVGTVPGKDAVQIYVSKPYTQYDIDNNIEKSAVDLVGYDKTKLLAPSETETVTIKIDKRNLTSYDANKAKTYILDEGDYYFTAAEDSHKAINNILLNQNESAKIFGEGNKDLASKVSLKFDDKTYSTSKNTSKEITNLFDDSDINKSLYKGDNEVKYLSRNDWNGTMPKTAQKLTFNKRMANSILRQENAKSVEEDKEVKYPKMGQNKGLNLITLLKDKDNKDIAYDDPIWDEFLDQLSWEDLEAITTSGFRGTELIESINKPKTVESNGPAGITQPYGANPEGLAARKNDPDKNASAPQYPCAGIIASTFSHEMASKFGKMLGEDAIWAGYAGFYGIGLNTHRAAEGGRAFEYFSEDPFLGGTTAANEVLELQKRGCNAYVKHFALNDQETNRTGVGIWLNEQSFREIYLRQFQIAVEDGGAMNAMTAFNRVGTEYSPANYNLVTSFLKEECGMRGLVVTDMYDGNYQPQNWPNFLMAGVDIPDGDLTLKHPMVSFTEDKGAYGNVAMRMRDAAHRICYATLHSNGMNGISANERLVKIVTPWQIALYTADSVFSVGFATSIAFAVYFGLKARKN